MDTRPAALTDETVFVRLISQSSGDNLPAGSMGTFLVGRQASVRANSAAAAIALTSTTEVLGYLNFP